ncbi:MAG: methylenetetrahydrofolate reductase C-terminal domain-containing protein [Desulfomonilaceae bacterium]
MIVAKPKPFKELVEMLGNFSRVLVAGCGTCVAVCLAGGEKEAGIVATQLELAFRDRDFKALSATVERQCDREFLALFRDHIDNVDAVLSLACGAGIQFLSDMYPQLPVFPGVDTSFIGVNEGAGIWTERCRACNQCYLGLTGGICPVTMCAKGLLNGPCGGPSNGKCETNPERDCAWVKIVERLKSQSRLDILENITPPRDFSLSQNPAKLVREDYQNRF